MTPGDVRACIAVFEVWEIAPGAQELPRRPDYLFIQPDVLGVAFGSYLKPFALQTYGRVIRHTLASLADFPSVLHPEGLRFRGVRLRLVRPLTQPYHFRSDKTRDKNLKNHDDFDHQADSLQVVGLGDSI